MGPYHTSDAADAPLAGGDRLTLSINPGRLEGQVTVAGAKNSVLRLMAATLLTSGRVMIRNYPASLLDAQVHLAMLERIGKHCTVADGTLTVSEAGSGLDPALAWEGRSLRNSLLIMGALVARCGSADVPLPGGCDLGGRGYDLHQLVLGAMGARVWAEDGRLRAEAPKGLTGADIHLPLRSTGATENALLAGSLARGTTRLWNPHIRPEILDLVRFLRSMGARITVRGTESIVIEGADGLDGTDWQVMPDNMEAMSWAIGAGISGGELELIDFPFDDLEVPLIFLRESGLRIERQGNRALVRSGAIYPVDLATGAYPGINSDMQPLFAAFAARAQGVSHIVDLRFPDRFAYLAEFAKLGVDCAMAGGAAVIRGGSPLRGAAVRATDLRAGAALAMLALVAEGPTEISDAWQILRGYSDFTRKLAALGIACTAR